MAPPKLTPGQPISFPAAEWNRHVDASDAYHRTKALGDGSAGATPSADSNVVNAKNTSGADRRKGEILEFNGSSLNDFKDGLLWLNGEQPQHAKGFGVLLQAVPNGKFQDCQVSGVCSALVNVTDTNHEYAAPRNGNAVLQSGAVGPVRILHKPSGTGEKTCVVRLEVDLGVDIVQVHHLDASPGERVVTNADGLHRGRIKRVKDGSMQTAGDCWILFVDSFDVVFGNVAATQDEYYGPARQCGEFTSGGTTLPLYLVKRSEAASLVVFQLTSTLTLGGVASANICTLTGGVYLPTGDGITVVDFYPGFGMWSGLAGYRGLARKRDDGLYDIVFMERPALIVKFVTNGNRNPAATAFTGTVVIAYQHGDRLPPGMDQYGNITIQDVEKLFPRALNGGTGLAIWNDLVGIYQCLTVQQQCVLARAQINDTGGMGQAGYIPISNFVACSPSPFNQVPSPAPTQAINFFLHRGRYQDDVLIAWDEASTDWIVIDVQKKSLELIADIRLKSDKTQIQVKQVRCAVEYQDDPNDPLRWIDKIPLKKCPTGSPLQ